MSPPSELVSATVARLERELLAGRARRRRPMAHLDPARAWPRRVERDRDRHDPRPVRAARALAAPDATRRAGARRRDRGARNRGRAPGPRRPGYGGADVHGFRQRRPLRALDPRCCRRWSSPGASDTAADSGRPLRPARAPRRRRGAVVEPRWASSPGGREARACALERGDHATLRACADASFDARARMMSLDPRHVEMVEIARAAGAAATTPAPAGRSSPSAETRPIGRRSPEQLGSAGCGVVLLQGPATVPPNPVT